MIYKTQPQSGAFARTIQHPVALVILAVLVIFFTLSMFRIYKKSRQAHHNQTLQSAQTAQLLEQEQALENSLNLWKPSVESRKPCGIVMILF